MKRVAISTRQSELALWQARHVAGLLCAVNPDLETVLLPMSTRGDVILDKPLAQIGGKGLFVKEIEQALLEGTADLAVHSLKDLPYLTGNGLTVAAFISRDSCADMFLSGRYRDLKSLPPGAVVGTSSLRRQAQVLALRPDLCVRPLRGNIQTRLSKLANDEYDAIILAEAGLTRLGLHAPHMSRLDPDYFTPALGQGVLAAQIRLEDRPMRKLCADINDQDTALCARAEWAFMERLGGGCRLPVGGLARIQADGLTMIGMVAKPDGSLILRETLSGSVAEPELVGRQLADSLLESGARQIIESLLQGQA